MDFDLETPVWVTQIVTPHNSEKLSYTTCLCGRKVISCTLPPVWVTYDTTLIHGVDDITVVIILHRQVDELVWDERTRKAHIRSVGRLKKDGYYLQFHDCQYAPIGTVSPSFSFPEKSNNPHEQWGEHIQVTDEQAKEFMRLWEGVHH